MYKNVTSNNANNFINDVISYKISGLVTRLNAILEGDEIENLKILDLLPAGMEYVSGSSSINYNLPYTGQTGFINNVPEVINNYNGTGRTALIWSTIDNFKGFQHPGNTDVEIFAINYKVKVTKNLNPGTNINNAYMIWDNNTQISPYGTTSSDSLDIDNDGDAGEKIIAGTASINYVAPKEVITTKLVKGSLDSLNVITPSNGKSEIDSKGNFIIRIFNNSIADLTKLGIVDELPCIGDTSTSPDTNGNYIPRGSEYEVKLTGPITAPPGYTVYYTTDTLQEDVSNYYNNSVWTSSTSDYSLVKGIKIVMNEGTVLAKESSVEFTLNINTPKDISLDTEDIAYNSFATTLNGTDFFESNKVGLEIVKYNVSGNIFEDINRDGIFQNDTDSDLAAYLVSLVDENGEPVNGLDGKPITTLTDVDGHYSMAVFREGNYKIKVELPEGYVNSEYVDPVTEDAMGSSIKPDADYKNILSESFGLNLKTLSVIRNAGYVYDRADLIVEKELYDNNGKEITEQRTFEYRLMYQGVPFNGKVTINDEEISIEDGAISFNNGETLIIKGLEVDGTFILEEINSDNYTTNPENKTFAGKLILGENKYTFKNTEKANGKLIVNKFLEDKNGEIIDESRDFKIIVTGPSYPEGKEYTLNSQEQLVIKDLLYGEYSVEETGVDEDYKVTIEGPVYINAEETTQIITVTNQELPKACISGIATQKVNNGIMPQTGNYIYMIAGFSILFIGFTFIVLCNKKQKN